MLLAGASWGVLNGSIASRVGIPALIVTLGTWQISKGVAFQVCRGVSIVNLPAVVRWWGSGDIAGVPVPIVIFIVTVVVAYFVLSYTTYGRLIYAVGGNPTTAWLSGVNVGNIRWTAFIVSGCLAGVAGLITLGRFMSAGMTTLTGLELDTVAAVFVGGISLAGGIGSVIGATLGAIIIGVIDNAMNVLGAGPTMVGILKGTIIIVAVAINVLRRRGR
jgi:ribose/xylose/arabinose/galactoside ABC-type transport system permease subunit